MTASLPESSDPISWWWDAADEQLRFDATELPVAPELLRQALDPVIAHPRATAVSVTGTDGRTVVLRSVALPGGGLAGILERAGTAADAAGAAELAARERRWRNMIAAAPDAMLVVDQQGTILFVNEQTSTLFGYDEQEILGKSVDLLVPDRFRGTHSGRRRGYVDDPVLRPMGAGLDLFGRRRDGSEFPAEVSLSPIGSGAELVVLAAIRDVSERKRAEAAVQELAEARRRRQEALQINDSIVQRASVAAYALDRGDEAHARSAIAETLRAARELIGNMVESGPSGLLSAALAETPEQRPADAARAPAAPEPAPAATGSVRVVVVDDTADVRMALRAVLTAAPDFTVVGEAGDGAEALRVVAEVQPDLVLLDLSMPVMDGLTALRYLRADHPQVKVVVLSGYGHDQAGAEAVAAGAAAYVEKGGSTRQLVRMLRDLFPERLAAPAPATVPAEPAPAAAADGHPLAAVIHEMRSPVAALHTVVRTLLDDRDRLPSGVVEELLRAALRNTGRLERTIEATVDTLRPGGADLDVVVERLHLTELVNMTVADLPDLTADHPVTVVVDTDADEVSADPLRLRQVLADLIVNAATFSPGGAPIEVAVSSDGTTVEVAVVDHGPGVPEHRLGELFRKFSRLGSTGPGLGLGLYLGREIARAHGGELALADTGPQGSTFVIQLPLLSQTPN